MGGGEGMEVDHLSRGAVAAMSRQLGAEVLRPVLQLLDAPRPLLGGSPPAARRYRLALSDGAHLQLGVLAASLNHLVTGGALRRGTVIRVLQYFSGVIQNQRVIIVMQLEILQAEFTLIGCPMIYEANATQRSGGLGSHGPCFMPVTPSVEPTVNNLPFGECPSSMPAQGTVDAKMQQLSLNDYQNQSFPRQHYNFRQIREIENMDIGAFVDLVGIITSVSPSTIMMRKDGTEAKKRTLQLKDMSGRSVEIIFWGKFCDAEGQQLQLLSDSDSNPILALKGGRISDFSGRSVVTISSTQLKVNPDVPVAERLKQWYMAGGKNAPCVSLSRDMSSISRIYVQKTIAQIKDENLGRSDKPDFITVRAVISHVKADNFCYPACTLELNGMRCYRKIKDHTATTYALAFQEVGEKIFGLTAQELFMIRNVEQDDARFAEIMGMVLLRECLFKLRIKAETFNGEQHLKCCIVDVERLDVSDINHHLSQELDSILKDVSHPILKEDPSYTPNVEYANLEGKQTMLTSSNACGYATGVRVAGYGRFNRMSPPVSASCGGPATATSGLPLQDELLPGAATGGGGGGRMEVDLSHGAVAAMSSHQAEGLLPVLQVADAPRLVGSSAAAAKYRIVLSDGAHLQRGVLATSLNHLVADGALRRGSVVRVLDYVCSCIQNQRVIVVIQLEVLQAECALIGSPTICEANATQLNGVSCSSSLGNEPCFIQGAQAQQAVNISSCYPGQGWLDSSLPPRAEHALSNLPFGGCYGSMPAQNTVADKMQQLSLNNDHQNQKFNVSMTSRAFGSPGNACGSPLTPSYLLSPPISMDRTHVPSNESPLRITPINALSPYQARWNIKARVTAKSDLRHFTNAKGPGKVFSFDLLDAEGGEVRATCFNLQAEQYFDLIEVDKVYLISEGSLKPAQKKFNPLNNDNEIFVDHRTSIEICSSGDGSIPKLQYDFQQISELENMGSETQKRTLQLKDMSGRSVEIIFWGKFCGAEGQQLQLLCDSGSNPILALKGVRISDFNGRSVVTASSTQLKINPDVPMAERLKQWYMSGGKTAPCVSLSQDISTISRIYVQKTIAQIKYENLGRSDKPDLITVGAVISHVVADNFCYPACTLEFNGKRCNKKVTRNGDWTWYCGRCNQSFENCEYRYLLLCQIVDHTGTTFATAFQEAGEAIVGYTAHELFVIRNLDQDEARFAEIMEAVLWRKYLFKLTIEEETFNGEQHVKPNIVGVEKLDASDVSHYLLKEIDNRLKDVSCSAPEDATSYNPNVGVAGLGAGQGMQTSSHAYGYTTGVGGAGPVCQ
ncbi:replication protein A 70 kDa DNA-binding subunit C-like [Panicum miliaceum]|uniref:Replication protein A 70 kDa DNA-binding subunit C-like n=1 Tax=Panicum miliaceum TaxID=4540 RepID=A0A3L6RD02_PANMI|nr:replication protein A 70 kDa DNA-binding subunit C-like [Panicum miliaceum]